VRDLGDDRYSTAVAHALPFDIPQRVRENKTQPDPPVRGGAGRPWLVRTYQMEKPMLVLTRRLGESVVIDGGIQITIVAAHGDKIRLGIVAPPSVRVDHKEVHDRRAEFDAGPALVEWECCALDA
jgi:carbon storage regulator